MKLDRVKLTPARIRDFTCPPDKTQAFLRDTESPRLAVRATRGAKSFIFEAKLNRQTIRITLGDTESWVLNSVWSGKGESHQEIQRGAREEASRLATLVDQGLDPRQLELERRETIRREQEAKEAEALRQAEEQVRLAITVGDAWDAYIQARTPRWGERNLNDHIDLAREARKPLGQGKNTKAGPIAALLPLRLGELTADALEAWQTEEATTRPGSAALAYRMVRAFLRWCAEQPDYRSLVDPATLLTKRVREAVPTVKAKDDCLQKEQLEDWFSAVRRISNPVISAYLQALLLTGARKEELAGLKWVDLDLRWNSMVIRDKVEGERIIPLTPYVLHLLRELKARNETPPPLTRRLRKVPDDQPPAWTPSPWVFPSRTAKTGRLVEARIAHNRALAAAGLPALSIHGLRRSFGTLSEWTECPVGVTAQIMGHKPSALAEKHYRRRPLDLLRRWHTSIEKFILDEAGIEQPQADVQAPRVRVVASQ